MINQETKDFSNLLASSEYLILNKTLVKRLGIQETVLFSELCNEYKYWSIKESLDNSGYFYSKIKNVEGNTTMSAKVQKKILDKFCEIGLIDVRIKGAPPKRYIKINQGVLISLLFDKNDVEYSNGGNVNE